MNKMRNFIKVLSVSAECGRLRVEYLLSSGIEKYFAAVRVFEVEYTEDVSCVPESVLVIPFVCNVLPIAWLADAVLEIPQLDREFYECIPDMLEGYKHMSPMLEFKGGVQVEQLIDNSYECTEKTAAFFSGGVDAFATLVAHAAEKPQLITLWGSDVKLTDVEGWGKVKTHIEETSHLFELPEPILVKSTFRTILNESELNKIVLASGEGWWYGYQHGIGIIGHAAPFAYLKRWKTVYFASTNTAKDELICASDPTIDNKLHLVSSRVWHDQYEYTRQQKVQHIVESCRKGAPQVRLRVCWQSEGGSNCCLCEKCARSLFAVLAEGASPETFGFSGWQNYAVYYSQMVRMQLYRIEHLRAFWQDIQNRFQETQSGRHDKRINWIYTLDVNHPLTLKMQLKQFVKQNCLLVYRGLRYVKDMMKK